MVSSNSEPGPVSWQEALRGYTAALQQDDRDRLQANAIRALDRATRTAPIQTADLARLGALSEYLSPRIERRMGLEAGSLNEPVMLGLMAGFQLALGAAAGLETDPFEE
jgi:hypothetical protein